MALSAQQTLFGTGQTEAKTRENKPNETPLTVLRRVEEQALKQLQIEQPAAAELASKIIIDPGADISPEDSDLWLWLFAAAERVDMELYAGLFYIRGAGARLEKHMAYGYSIRPVIDPAGKKGWTSLEEYRRERQCLAAYRTKLIEMLRDLQSWQKREL
jgi:hypothetical protein